VAVFLRVLPEGLRALVANGVATTVEGGVHSVVEADLAQQEVLFELPVLLGHLFLFLLYGIHQLFLYRLVHLHFLLLLCLHFFCSHGYDGLRFFVFADRQLDHWVEGVGRE